MTTQFKDRLIGVGNPNGIVNAEAGVIYQDKTPNAGVLWFNQVGGTAWVQITTGNISSSAKVTRIVGTGNKTTTSTSFTNIDNTNLPAIQLNNIQVGQIIRVALYGTVNVTSGAPNLAYFDTLVTRPDTTTIRVNSTGANGGGIFNTGGTSSLSPFYYEDHYTATQNGNHTFQLQWKVDTGKTATLYNDTVDPNRYPISFVVEIPGLTSGGGGGGGGVVDTVTNADATIITGGTATDVTLRVGTIAEGQVSNLLTDLAARLQSANNLSDVASVSTSRTNLGLGTIATQNANAVAITGGAITNIPATVRTTSATTDTWGINDAGEIIRYTAAGAVTSTIPLNATVAFPLQTVIGVYAQGAGGVTVVGAGGVTIRNNTAPLVQYQEVSFRQDATDEWVRVG